MPGSPRRAPAPPGSALVRASSRPAGRAGRRPDLSGRAPGRGPEPPPTVLRPAQCRPGHAPATAPPSAPPPAPQAARRAPPRAPGSAPASDAPRSGGCGAARTATALPPAEGPRWRQRSATCPAERGPHVVVLHLEALQPVTLVRPSQRLAGLLGQGKVVGGVTPVDCRRFTVRLQLLEGKGTDRFQLAEGGPRDSPPIGVRPTGSTTWSRCASTSALIASSSATLVSGAMSGTIGLGRVTAHVRDGRKRTVAGEDRQAAEQSLRFPPSSRP